MTSIPFPVEIRTADFPDHPLIYGAWLESYKKDATYGSWLGTMKWNHYRKLETKIIDNAINNGVCVVASVPEDRDHILGFAVGSLVNGQGVLHYVYVRPNRRHVGLGKTLSDTIAKKLNQPLVEYSHNTRAGQEFAQKLNLLYNPLTAISF